MNGADVQFIKERSPSRINVVGTSGSGKSFFSKELASILKTPYVQLDQLFWGPQWSETSDEEFFAKISGALRGNSWVLDGNFDRTSPIKWKNVELVVWIDYPLWLTLYQAIRRAVLRAWTQEEIWQGTGNRESFKKSFFSSDSIIWWTIKTYSKVKRRYLRYMSLSEYSHIKFIRVQSRSDAMKLLLAFKEVCARK